MLYLCQSIVNTEYFIVTGSISIASWRQEWRETNAKAQETVKALCGDVYL